MNPQLTDALELERITQSEHHKDIGLQVVDFPPFEHYGLLALDAVGNPHNPGARMRVAAHYGVGGFLAVQVSLLRSDARQMPLPLSNLMDSTILF